MGETAGGTAILLLIIFASKLVIASVVTTLGLLYLIGANRLHRHWVAPLIGLSAGCAVSFIYGASFGIELLSSVQNLVFTIPPAVLIATLWTFSRPQPDGYRTRTALFVYVALWVFVGFSAILLPFSLL